MSAYLTINIKSNRFSYEYFPTLFIVFHKYFYMLKTFIIIYVYSHYVFYCSIGNRLQSNEQYNTDI